MIENGITLLLNKIILMLSAEYAGEYSHFIFINFMHTLQSLLGPPPLI